MSWLFDLFVAPEISPAEIADMNVETVTWAVGELREPGVAEGMTDQEIAEAILDYAKQE